MGKKRLTKSNIILLSFAALFLILSVAATAFAGKIGLVRAYTNGDPELVAKNFFNGVISADYDTAVHYLSDCAKLNLENPNEGDAAKVYDSLLDSYSYKVTSVKNTGITASVAVDFSSLNLNNLEKNIKNEIKNTAETMSNEYEYDFVFDENRNYTDAFVKTVMETIIRKIGESDEFISKDSLTLDLVYVKGEWMIKQTPDLVRVLSGDTIKGKQAASVLNLSGTIGKSAERILKKASGELLSMIATPTPTPTPTATPTPTPTLAPGITPTTKPFRVSTAEYTLDEYEKVAPKPDASKFGFTNNPQVILDLLETEEAKKLLNGQPVTFRADLPFVKSKKMGYYLDETILVITWTELSAADTTSTHTSYLSFAEVAIADGSQLRRKLAGDAFGSGIELKASEMAKSANAVVAFGGDFYSFKKKGICVFEHRVCREMLKDNTDTCFFRTDGEMLFTRPGFFSSTEDVQKYVDENNISFAVTFGPVIVENWKPIYHDKYPLGQIDELYSRTGFGILGDNHYLVMDANWEYTLDRAADIICDRGVEKAYALDGGQSSVIILDGKVQNFVAFNEERAMSDIIYFATAIPSE